MGRQRGAAADFHGRITSLFAQHAFIGVVSSIDTANKLVFITRPGQTQPDTQGYKALIGVISTLAMGNSVSVIAEGGSWVVHGAIDI